MRKLKPLLGIFTTLIILSSFASYGNLYAQYGWHYQNSNSSNTFGGICFANENTGFATGYNGTLRKTTNGGDTWIIQSIGVSSYLHKIAAMDSNTWTIVGEAGLLLHSTNAGADWIVKSSGTTGNLNRVRYVKTDTGVSPVGYIVGVNGYMLKTENGGDTWTNLMAGVTANLYDLNFINSNTGYAVGENIVIKTTNGGDNWVNVTPSISRTLMGVSFRDANTGIVVGGTNFFDNGIIFKTTNGGNSWSTFSAGSFSGAFKAMWRLPNNYISVVGSSGFILMSTDDGGSWTIQSSPTSSILEDVCFINSVIGYAAGHGGTIIRTLSGGVTSVTLSSTEVPDKYSLSQNYPNPFNPSTKIKFGLTQNSNAKLLVLDALGRQVDLLIDKNLNAGEYEFTWNADRFTSGIYFYRLETEDFVDTRKMMLIK